MGQGHKQKRFAQEIQMAKEHVKRCPPLNARDA